jgi:hypothetical protein
MRTKLLIILFTLNFIQSYSQDFWEIKIDSKLQIKYSDTLQSIGERITGKWKYLGKKINGNLTDTIGTNLKNGERTLITIENGIVFKTKRNVRKKADFFYQIDVNFKNGKIFYSETEISINGNWESFTSCAPIPELVFYKGQFGILFIGMGGQSFSEINKLTSEKLVIENGKEYLKFE